MTMETAGTSTGLASVGRGRYSRGMGPLGGSEDFHIPTLVCVLHQGEGEGGGLCMRYEMSDRGWDAGPIQRIAGPRKQHDKHTTTSPRGGIRQRRLFAFITCVLSRNTCDPVYSSPLPSCLCCPMHPPLLPTTSPHSTCTPHPNYMSPSYLPSFSQCLLSASQTCSPSGTHVHAPCLRLSSISPRLIASTHCTCVHTIEIGW